MADHHVRRSGEDYAQALLNLLPRGQAWPREPGCTLVLTCTGLALYYGFVDGRAADLLETESDPRLTVELITDWERNWGLPDPCISNPPHDLQNRHNNLVTKMTLLGAQSRAFFINLAKQLGFTITISEFCPYMCGVSHVGDRTGIYNPEDPNYPYWQLGPPEIRYNWIVHVNAAAYWYFRTGSSQCGIDRLLAFSTATDLECIINRYKPAHTLVVYDYSPAWSLDNTQPFDSQYLLAGWM